MKISNNISGNDSNEDYNSIPVAYCKNCLSLKIVILEDNIDYCDECGSTNIDSTDIESWEEIYKKKYGKPLIIKKNGKE